MGLGDNMGKVEIDDRGRLTLPSKIRERLLIKSGDKLSIKVNKDNSITIKKSPTKEQIFKELVGCITTPIEEEGKITPEMIKSIWKQNP
jgi:AbrB family looped-hinge helix DNA binding protein